MIGFKIQDISVKRSWLLQLLLTCSVLTVAMLPVSAQAQGICDRTPQVQVAILEKITSATDCALVTTTHLNAITALNLINTRLTSLTPDDFEGLTSLTDLGLDNNSIVSLPEDIFDGLTSLTYLGLSNSNITSLPEDVFDGLASLTTLRLNSNSITSLPDDVFGGLTSLATLRLNNNSITSLPDDVFDGLVSLTTLHLENNNIASFPTEALSTPPLLGVGAGFLRIENNPRTGSPPFNIPYELVRTDEGTASPAIIQVRLPSYVRSQGATLSARGGMLTVARRTTTSSSIPAASIGVYLNTHVTVTATGDTAVIVSATPPSGQRYRATNDGMVVRSASPLEIVRIDAATGTPAITKTDIGTPAVGKTLTATQGTLDDPNGLPNPFVATSYQWQRSAYDNFTYSMDIPNAIHSTYNLTADDAGMYISVRVSFTDDANNPEVVTSATTRIAATDLCDRTPQVQTAILARISGVSNCLLVTTAQLNELTGALGLHNTELTSLMPGDFADLTSLTTLYLNSNSIASLPEDVFDGLTSLTTLYLNSNSIALLPEDVFDGLTSLTTLYLNGNSIVSLPNDVFDGLTSLTALWLNGNNMDSFPTEALSALSILGTGHYGKLRIENNPNTGSSPFSIPYELVRTDGGTASPATIQVRLPRYVPSELRSQTATLSAMDGMLAVAGGAPATSVMVAPYTDVTVVATGNPAVKVSATAPSRQTAVNGMVVEDASTLEVVPMGATMGTLTITGTVALGQTLMTDTSTIRDPDGPQTLTFSYQWQRSTDKTFDNPIKITGTTSATYRLTTADFGKYLRVVVSFTDSADNVEAVASAPIALAETNLCDRTPQVQTAILRRVRGVNDCALVTTAQLNELTGTLYLYGTRLTSLMPGDFDGLTSLLSLSLYSNSITSLPEDVFEGLTSLTSLSLGRNSITSLPEGVFDNLTSLTHLGLYNNSITSLPDDVFDGLTSLTSLNLENNNITSFPTRALNALPILGTGEGSLRINSNPNWSSPPFRIPYELVRTDGGTGSPATMQVRLPLYVPANLRSQTAVLSATNGTLAIGEGTPVASVRVALNTDVTVTATGDTAVIVSATATSSRRGTNGMVVGNASPLEIVRMDAATGAPATTRTDTRTPLVGQTLTATQGTLDDPNGLPNPFVATAYQWQRSTDEDFTNSMDIPDAIHSAYDLTADDAGMYIQVRVSFTDDASNPEIVTSAAIRIAITNLCDRTPQVRDAILRHIRDANNCFVATTAQLNSLIGGPLDLGGPGGALYLEHTGLTSLMPGDFANLASLTRLYLGSNSIDSLPDGVFDDLTSLTHLGLIGNSITTLPDDVFDSLTRLTYLELSGNSITSWPEDIFNSLTGLTYLGLRGSSITSLPADIFDGSTSLTKLDLSGNSITALPDDVFDGLTSLTWLYLNDNNIASFPTKALSALPILGTGEGFLTIANNPNGDSSPLSVPYELVRTDGGTTSPATIQVRLPVYVPAYLRSQAVTLSAIGGMLTVAGGTPGTSVRVAPDTDVTVSTTGDTTVIVSATVSSGQTAVLGMVVGNASPLEVVRMGATTGAPAITRTDTGTPVAGQTLTATPGTLDDPNGLPNPFVATAYQWQRSTDEDFTNSMDIQDAVHSTYNLTADDGGMYIRVRVSFTDRATNPEIVTSAARRIAATDLCDRTPLVQTAILSRIPGVFDCLVATTAQLNALTGFMNIHNDRLTSLMPGDFDGLMSLTGLDLRRSSIDSLPEGVFDGLTSLTHLDLRSNGITTLPLDVFDGLTSLETLYLRFNSIDSLPEDIFDGLTSLTTLSLGNNIDSLPDDVFDGLASLTSLVLYNNSITSLPPGVFDGLTSLTSLILSHNSIASLPEDVFDGLTSLKHLDLDDNSITSLPEDVFGGLASLTHLDLRNNGITTLPPDVFEGLTSLEILDFYRNSITLLPDDVFEGLTSLTTLSLGDNNIDSLTADDFDGLTNLTHLGLGDNNITSLPDDVFEGLTNLTHLGLGDNNIDSLPDDVFDGLASLTSLVLYNNSITSLPPGVFDGLTSLTYLDLRNNLGTPFAIPYELVRTDSGATSPATIQVHLPVYVHANLRSQTTTTTLSVTGGALAIGEGSAVASITVALDTDVTVIATGDPAVIVSATAPSSQRGINGMVVGDAVAFRVIEGNTPAEGAPTIAGIAQVGEELTASVDAITDADGLRDPLIPTAYQWQRSSDEDFTTPINIDGATGATYTLDTFDAGNYIRVVVSFTDSAGNAEVVFSRPTNGIAVNICIRTPQVRDAILVRIPSVDDCALVTTAQLNALTGILDLSNTGLTSLASGDFGGLTSLTYLNLDNNNMTSLPPDVFDGLTRLVFLRLGNNGITSLPNDVFDGLTSLTSLILSRNSIASLHEDTFDGWTNLEALDLFGNSITTLPEDVFDDLTSLTFLDLSSNSITSLSGGVFDGLTSLTSLSLHSNSITLAIWGCL